MSWICVVCGRTKKSDIGDRCENCRSIGHKVSEDARKRISAAMSCRTISAETREKFRIASLGNHYRHNSPIRKEKHSRIYKSNKTCSTCGKTISMSAIFCLPCWKAKGIGNNRGKKMPPVTAETRAKISAASKKQVRGPGTGTKLSPEHKAKLLASHLGVPMSEEEKQKHRLAFHPSGKNKNTTIELAIASLLMAWRIPFIQQHLFRGIGSADFFLPHTNQIIECDGTYWHNKPGRKERDAKKDATLLEQGIRTIRLSEEMIKHDWESLLERLYRFLIWNGA